jgi:site-specific DNA recombinase
MNQAAMYVRVSTQRQKEEETIESQKEILFRFAKSKGFEICSEWVFEDNGISGSTLARPALDKLRDYAAEGLFDHVFILSPDRLSRKYAYQAILIDEFKSNEVTLVFQNSPTPQTASDNLLLQMQGMFAEYERAQIAERSRRGKKHKAKQGHVSVLSQAPYGYRYIKGTKELSSYFEVIEREATVVKIIFDLYVKERLSISKIQEYLSIKQIISAQGKSNWSRSSINNVLSNSTYHGIAYYGKREKSEPDSMRLAGRRSRLKGKYRARKSHREKNRDEWIKIPVPAIIDLEIFESAQELLKKNKKQSLRNSQPGSLLQGLVSCKECGYGFVSMVSGKKANGYSYYRCNRVDKKCTNPGIRMDSLDRTIWDSIISMLESPDLIQQEVERRLTDLDKAPMLQKEKLLKGKLVKLDVESNRLLDAYQNGCVELSELQERMGRIKREKNNIVREVEQTRTGLSKQQLLELNEAVKCFSEQLRISRKNLSLEQKRKILRMLIQEIKIGKEGISIEHIIPVKKKLVCDEIARLRLSCQGTKTQISKTKSHIKSSVHQ